VATSGPRADSGSVTARRGPAGEQSAREGHEPGPLVSDRARGRLELRVEPRERLGLDSGGVQDLLDLLVRVVERGEELAQ
jgi:hypothetical protein